MGEPITPSPDLPSAPASRRYLCRRATMPARIDGDVEKPFWRAADWTEPFVDIEGDLRPSPPLATRAKLLWDDEALYIAARMDEPDVWGTLTERDSVIFHDNDFEVFLNPTCDARDYYELEINALGTVWDLVLPVPYRAGGKADNSWDCPGLRAAVRIDGTLNRPGDVDRGWGVEIAMPWSAFDRHARVPGFPGPGSPPRRGDSWLLNFSRVEWDVRVEDGRYVKIPGRPEHNWVWSPMGLIDMHVPLRWGMLAFE